MNGLRHGQRLERRDGNGVETSWHTEFLAPGFSQKHHNCDETRASLFFFRPFVLFFHRPLSLGEISGDGGRPGTLICSLTESERPVDAYPPGRCVRSNDGACSAVLLLRYVGTTVESPERNRRGGPFPTLKPQEI